MIIRNMLPEEIDSVAILFEYYREDALIRDEDYSPDRVLETIKTYCINWNLFFQVAYEGGRPIGLIGGFVSNDPIDGRACAAIQFCYMVDSHNSIDNYRELVQAFEAWAREVQASSIKALDIGNRLDRLQYLYQTLGYKTLPLVVMGKEI